jgi:hypothetical protein
VFHNANDDTVGFGPRGHEDVPLLLAVNLDAHTIQGFEAGHMDSFTLVLPQPCIVGPRRAQSMSLDRVPRLAPSLTVTGHRKDSHCFVMTGELHDTLMKKVGADSIPPTFLTPNQYKPFYTSGSFQAS